MDARARLAMLAISPSGFVFDPKSGTTFTVNETGRLILEGVRDGLGLQALTATLAERFDAGAEEREAAVGGTAAIPDVYRQDFEALFHLQAGERAC